MASFHAIWIALLALLQIVAGEPSNYKVKNVAKWFRRAMELEAEDFVEAVNEHEATKAMPMLITLADVRYRNLGPGDRKIIAPTIVMSVDRSKGMGKLPAHIPSSVEAGAAPEFKKGLILKIMNMLTDFDSVFPACYKAMISALGDVAPVTMDQFVARLKFAYNGERGLCPKVAKVVPAAINGKSRYLTENNERWNSKEAQNMIQ